MRNPKDVVLLALSAACAAGIALIQHAKKPRPRFPRLSR